MAFLRILFRRFLIPGFVLLASTQPIFAQSPASGSATSELHLDWVDSARNRPVPVKIYLPAPGSNPSPIIIFSHGLGGSRDGYAYLGKYWSEHGFVSVHLQHLGSDEALWKDSKNPMKDLSKAVLNPENAMDRPKDVSFAIDQLTLLNTDSSSPLYHRLDLKNIGMAGHSFGAFTTLAVAGETFGGKLSPNKQVSDPRITAAIEMSAPGLRPGVDPAQAYASIHLPFMHITGTEDKISAFLAPQDRGVEDRRVPFDSIQAPHQYLIIYKDADHMVFADSGRRAALPQDKPIRDSVCIMTTAFWNAWLKKDPRMENWLDNGEARKSLTGLAVLEAK